MLLIYIPTKLVLRDEFTHNQIPHRKLTKFLVLFNNPKPHVLPTNNFLFHKSLYF